MNGHLLLIIWHVPYYYSHQKAGRTRNGRGDGSVSMPIPLEHTRLSRASLHSRIHSLAV